MTESMTEQELRDQVDLSHTRDREVKAQILEILGKHGTMWSGKLGTTETTENRIDIEPGTG